MLPALLALVLALLFVVQFILPGDVPEPPVAPPGVGAVPAGALAMTVGRTVKPQELLHRPLFAPRGAMSVAGSAPPSPLGGAAIAGSVARGRRLMAVVRGGDGRIFMVPLGGTVSGWRIVALGQGGAVLRKGGETLELPYGAQAVAGDTDAEESDEDAEE